MKKLEDLDNKNLIILFDTAREIVSELELENGSTVTIKAEQDKVEANLSKYLPDYSFDIIKELRRLRHRAVKYLQYNKIVTRFKLFNNDQDIEIFINQEKLATFYRDITRIYTKRCEEDNKKNDDKILEASDRKTIYDSGFNNLLTKEPLFPPENIELSLIRGELELQGKKRDIQHKQKIKNDRILATKKDKYVHALEVFIEKLQAQEQSNSKKNISIDYYYFNFEDRIDDSKLIESYWDKLKKDKCFKKWERSNYAGGTKFSFFGVNLEKIKSLKNREERPKIKSGKSLAFFDFKNNKPNNWSDIKLELIRDSRDSIRMEEVIVYINNKKERKVDCANFGYPKTKNGDVRKPWLFLVNLAIIKESYEKGHYTSPPTKSLICSRMNNISINNCEQHKRSISKKLKEIFDVSGKPFQDYHKETGYIPRFELIIKDNSEIYISNRPEFNDEKIKQSYDGLDCSISLDEVDEEI